MKKVTIYSTPTCGYCKIAKDFFDEKCVEYTDYDLASDEKRRSELLEKSGQMGVPFILIESDKEGEEPVGVIGFDKERLVELLELE